MANNVEKPHQEQLVSVFVCTRNRAANVIPTVTSIQACGHDDFELFVLDQSDDDATQQALSRVCSADPRVNHVRLPRPGKPLALTEGLRRARGSYILLTDDDCEVKPGWIASLVASFHDDPRVGCVYGSVEAAAHDPGEGYIPHYALEEPRTIFKLRDLLTMPGWGNLGMGASMAVRTDVALALGWWDPCIGPGTKFGSGDDTDLAVRTLRAGQAVHFCPTARVVHYGLRYWKSARTDFTRIAYGLGSIFAKHIRCGAFVPGAFRPALFFAKQSVGLLAKAQRPAGAVFVIGWCRGFLAGMRQPLDRGKGTFIPDGNSDAYRGRVAEVVLRTDQTPTATPSDG